jgi:ABC-type branched-subunit amino acid transport system ATPase component
VERDAPTPPTGVGLSVRDVAVSFGGITALDGVSVDVSPGEVLGVIGPNGAGKTTLFNVI